MGSVTVFWFLFACKPRKTRIDKNVTVVNKLQGSKGKIVICCLMIISTAGFHCHTTIETIQQTKSRIKEEKEDE